MQGCRGYLPIFRYLFEEDEDIVEKGYEVEETDGLSF